MRNLTEDEQDQINEAYQLRDLVLAGLGFTFLIVIIAFGCYVIGGEG